MSETDADERPLKLIIQIPCFNEADTLAETLADLPRVVPGIDTVEWLIIDDGCTDGTADVARANGVDHVVSHTRNRGLAAAFLTGLEASLQRGADIIVNTDADNQYVGDCIPDLIAPVRDGEADMVVGERPVGDIDDFSWSKKKLQRLGSWVVRKFSGTDVADAPSGFRAMSREAALRLQVFGKFSYTMETLVQANAEGLAVVSVPVRVNPQTRPSRLAKSTLQYLSRSSQTIVRSFALYYPFKFFFRVGLVPFTLGLVLMIRWGVLFLFEDPYRSRVPSLVAGGVLLIVAVQIWVVAFLADLQAANRRLLADARVSERRRRLDRTQIEATPKRYVVVKGRFGMGHRITVLLAAARYANETDRQLVVDWNDHTYFSPVVPDVFQGLFRVPSAVPLDLPALDGLSVYPSMWEGRLHEFRDDDEAEIMPYEMAWAMPPDERPDPDDPRDPAAADVVVITRQGERERFSDSFADLRFQAWLDKRIERFAGQHDWTRMVGVQVRHGNGEQYLTPADTAWFHERIAELLEMSPDLMIFLSTDSSEVLDEFEARYSGLVHYPKWYPAVGSGSMHHNEECPDRFMSGADALADMWMLGRCAHLLLCDGGFGRTASSIAPSPERTVDYYPHKIYATVKEKRAWDNPI